VISTVFLKAMVCMVNQTAINSSSAAGSLVLDDDFGDNKICYRSSLLHNLAAAPDEEGGVGDFGGGAGQHRTVQVRAGEKIIE
jgi:hypothetical protein